jgi:hypothetical protein
MSTPISRLDSGAPDFIETLDALLAFDASTDDAIEMAVAEILAMYESGATTRCSTTPAASTGSMPRWPSSSCRAACSTRRTRV